MLIIIYSTLKKKLCNQLQITLWIVQKIHSLEKTYYCIYLGVHNLIFIEHSYFKKFWGTYAQSPITRAELATSKAKGK